MASLIELAFRSGSRTPAPGLASYLERILLDQPWADPEIPSLVSLDDRGQVVGFLGSHIRRFRFDGKPIRLAVSGQLVSDPTVRRQAVGAFLMKRYLEGPQDVTLTDTASETVRRMWEGFGGETVHLGRIGWLRPFRPLRFASDVPRSAVGGRETGRNVTLRPARRSRDASREAGTSIRRDPMSPRSLSDLMRIVRRLSRWSRAICVSDPTTMPDSWNGCSGNSRR